jgi:hypothetical protein
MGIEKNIDNPGEAEWHHLGPLVISTDYIIPKLDDVISKREVILKGKILDLYK